MSEEDAFLDGIAADRADRTRLLVFADWLAERADPREQFVRLHARLLDMAGSEPGFEELDRQWGSWVGWSLTDGARRRRLDDRWLDALCRVCTTSDVDEYHRNGRDPEPVLAEVAEYGHADHLIPGAEKILTLYHGRAADYPTPFEFVSDALLPDLWRDPFIDGRKALASCYPLTRGRFWHFWRELCGDLRTPPPLPQPAADNLFLGAEFINPEWNNSSMVAVYQHDYFALFWRTTA